MVIRRCHMKLTKEERLDIGRRMYNKELSYKDAMELYNICETTAHKCMTDYKRSQGIPVNTHIVSAQSIQHTSFDTTSYMSMSKEELINELIKAKANELRAKKGYEVKGVGANKEFIPLNNKSSK